MSTAAPRTTGETVEAGFTFVKRSFLFWKRSILVFILVALAAIPGVFMKARVYKSETVVLYQETINSKDITGGDNAADGARRAGARLKEMLLSRASLEPIIMDLPRYAKIADRRGMVDAVDELRGHISFRAREGDTFEIGFEGASPEEVQDVTRRLGERIVQEASSRRAEQAKALKEFLDAESSNNNAKLKVSEADFARFLTQHPEFLPLTLPGAGRSLGAGGVTGPGGFIAPPPPNGTKDPVLYSMEAEAASIDRQLRIARGIPVSVPAPAAPVDTPDIAAARADLAEKRGKYTEKHPDVVAARTRLQQLLDAQPKKPLVEEAPTPTGSKLSDAEKESLEARLTQLRRAIAVRRQGGNATAPPPAASGSAGNVPGGSVANEVEFRRLQREVEDLRERQKQLDDKQFKASITASSVMSDRNIQVSILDPAYKPAHPIGRSRSVGLAMFLAAAFFLAMLTAFISTRLDDRIYERQELELLDVLPVVGAIPRASKRRA